MHSNFKKRAKIGKILRQLEQKTHLLNRNQRSEWRNYCETISPDTNKGEIWDKIRLISGKSSIARSYDDN